MAANKFRMNHFMNLCKATRLLLIMGTLLLVACSEDDETVQPEPDYSKVYLVKKKTLDTESMHNQFHQAWEYEYDTAGKILKTIYTNPGGTLVCDYSYIDPNSITIFVSSTYGITDTVRLRLNTRGLVVSHYKPAEKYVYKYQYDEEGYCTLSQTYKYGVDTSDIIELVYTSINKYTNGNLVEKIRNPGGDLKYSYHEDKVNTLGYYNFGETFWGKSSKNLAKEEGMTDEFDSAQRLVKRYRENTVYGYEYY